jgi:serine phosphatase RsbU (regulator of sigma subunit)
MEALKASVLNAHSGSAAEIVSAIESAVNRFTAGAPPIDDITLVVVKRV